MKPADALQPYKQEREQQLYQPDQTTLSDGFAELQAIAEGLVSRLQTVSLSDETTKKIQELALIDARNSAGRCVCPFAEGPPQYDPGRGSEVRTFQTGGGVQYHQYGLGKRDRPDRAAWGDEFDVSILDDHKAGVNLWA